MGRLRVRDAAPDRISDVASLGRYAYLGAFAEPSCRRGGVYVVDISNPRRPRQAGFIRARPGRFVGEGVQALRLRTRFFRGDLLVHNNELCSAPGRSGGMSLWDVTRPRRPRALAQNRGDTRAPDGRRRPATQIHSVFAWQQGRRAFAVQVDDDERGDVDIFEITNPRRPRHVAEVGLRDWPGAQDGQAAGMGTFPVSLHHDVQVRNLGGHWRMLLSYWDAGYVLLDVDDPARPRFLEDSDFPDPDRLTGLAPEGNAHYAEWDRTGRYVLAADEDFDPLRFVGRIVSGPFSGEQFVAPQASGVPQVDPEHPVAGPTSFVGVACDAGTTPAAPAGGAIAVIERGDCDFATKARNVAAKGYRGGIVFNAERGATACEGAFGMIVTAHVHFLGVVPRSLGYRLLGIAGYDGSDCPDRDDSQPRLPAPGTPGADLDIRVLHDGWGALRLLDATTLDEVGAYAIPEALDRRNATGFGDLSIHETAADPTRDLVYAAWYSGGFRVLSYGPGGLQEVGRYIDRGGNDFWGVEVHRARGGRHVVLASDRDRGLYVFRYAPAGPGPEG
ncbi:MAG: hypothetical protein M3N16_05485 [Actinomycetota bacterium]|nr:hypothetical protein [Actinomycetota bacterium]